MQKRGLTLFVLSLMLSASTLAAIMPDDRRIDWDPGVRGGIPERTTICATLNPGDNIQSAIDSCPTDQVVLLNPGTYTISSTVKLKSGVTLRGSGIDSTILKGASGLSEAIITLSASSSDGSAVSLTGTPTKGDTTITTSSAHGWSVGDYILIDQLEDKSGSPVITNDGSGGACTWCGLENGNRPVSQWTQVTAAPTSTSATINPPLYWSYETSLDARALEMRSVITYAGIEDLTIDNSVSKAPDPVQMLMAVNSWFLRVKMICAPRHMLKIRGGLWNTIRGCYLEAAHPISGSDQLYGFYMIMMGSAFQIEDNILDGLFVPIAYEGGQSGHVIAYNYFVNSIYKNNDDTPCGICLHGAHPVMDLFEGNYLDEAKYSADFYWGSSSHQTIFRNMIIPGMTAVNSKVTITLEENTGHGSIIGNRLGVAGINNYILNDPYSGQTGIYFFENGVEEMFLHGNWDSYNNGVIWEPGYDQDFPDSLYLDSRPSWWCTSLDWPSVGYDVSTASNNIPAKIRYEGGQCDTGPVTQPCGNNIRESTETCDGTDLAGQTCITQGFSGGTLACNSQCTGFITTGCSTVTCSQADSDADSTVSTAELNSHIAKWKRGEIDLNELMIGISEWKNGC